MNHLHNNKKQKNRQIPAAESPHFKQEGIASTTPPSIDANADPVSFKKEEEEEGRPMQKKKNSQRLTADDSPAIPPTTPNGNALSTLQRKHNAYRPSTKQHTAFQLPVQQKSVESARQPEPFQLKSSGVPQKNQGQLPQEVQAKMENSMGHDFSNVNIHKNSKQATDAGALAYAQGNDVHFAPGQFKPDTTSGQELIGHELAHVVQQREGRVKPTKMLGKGMPVNDDPRLEKEADDMGRKAAQSKKDDTVQAKTKQPGHLQTSAPVQMRLPTFANLRKAFTGGSVPESVVIEMVSQALHRMQARKQLLSTDPIPDIIARIFPAPGVINEAEFNNVVDVADRSRIYQTVTDAHTPVADKDKTKFKELVKKAVEICRISQGMNTSLERIFGTKTSHAKKVYEIAGDKLERFLSSDAIMDADVSTDYNGDDSELGLGGYAWNGQMHLMVETVQGLNWKDSVLTIIHEASHLTNLSVGDQGYYPPQTDKNTFAGYTEDEKITNAAHFEEFPRRWLGESAYGRDFVFTPGLSVSGGALTPLQKAKNLVNRYFEAAWNDCLDIHDSLVRGRRDILSGTVVNVAGIAKALDYSRLAELSLHHQTAGSETINQLDITQSEGIANSISLLWGRSGSARFDEIPASANLSDIKAAKIIMIDRAITLADVFLLGDSAKDKVLLDWLAT